MEHTVTRVRRNKHCKSMFTYSFSIKFQTIYEILNNLRVYHFKDYLIKVKYNRGFNELVFKSGSGCYYPLLNAVV